MWLLYTIFLVFFEKTLGEHYWCNYFGTIPPEAYPLDNRTSYYVRAISNLRNCGVVGGVIKPGQKYIQSPCIGLHKIFLFTTPFQVLCTSNPASLQWSNDLNKKNQAIKINKDESEKPSYISKSSNQEEENYGTTYIDDGIHHYINPQNEPMTIGNFKFQFLIDQDSLKRQGSQESLDEHITYVLRNATNSLTEDFDSEILKELKIMSKKIDNIEKALKDTKPRRKLFSFFTDHKGKSKNVETFSPESLKLVTQTEELRQQPSNKILQFEDLKPETIIHLTNLGKNATINLDVDKDTTVSTMGRRQKRSKQTKSKQAALLDQLLQLEKVFVENLVTTENILDQILPTTTSAESAQTKKALIK